jgi:hypothetical protein
MSVPTGLSVTGSPITTSGKFTISFAEGYSIPTTTKQGNWDTAYGWGNHASAGYTKNTGTVTSVAAGTGLSGGKITTTGTISLADATKRTAADTSTHHLVYRDEGKGVMKYETGVYIGGELGELHATTFKIAEKATLVYDTAKSAVKFVFS